MAWFPKLAVVGTAVLFSLAAVYHADGRASALGSPRPTNAGPRAAATLDTAALERSVHDEMRITRTPGVAVAIVSGGSVVYAKGFGVASIETGAPATPDMLFRVGSVTKMFTGLTAVMLAREG